MFGWLNGGGSKPGWLAVSLDAGAVAFAHARRARGARARVSAYGTRPLDESRRGLERLKRELGIGRYQCSTMLRAGEYDLVLVDAPGVPRAELKSALRWKVKDMVDYPIDEATVDFLEIPPQEPGAAARQLYAVLARNQAIEACVRRFDDAGIALRVIEIPDTAQRNIAALYEQDGRGMALLYLGSDWGLITVSCQGELYLSRRLDLGMDAVGAEGADRDALERVALEVQRTFDHFERQFRYVAIGELLLAPTGAPSGLPQLLQERFPVQVRAIDLTEVLAFDGVAPDATAQWRLFHQFGAALREGSS